MKKIVTWDKIRPHHPIVFQHVAKAAGSTWIYMARQIYGLDFIRTDDDTGNVFWEERQRGELNFRCMAGHFHTGSLMYNAIEENYVHLAIFRDPIDKALSHYYYVQMDEVEHHLKPMAKKYSIPEIFKYGLGVEMQMQNQTVKQLSGIDIPNTREALEIAKDTVDNYTFFGLFQHFPEFVQMCNHRIRWYNQEEPGRYNISKRPSLDKEFDQNLDVLVRHNELDLELWDYIQARYRANEAIWLTPIGPSETRGSRRRLTKFCQGNGLDLGFGGDPITRSAITLDLKPRHAWVGEAPQNIAGDATDLKWFRDSTLDFIYSSHLLEDFPPEDTVKILTEWLRVIKPGGNLVLLLPDEPKYHQRCIDENLPYNKGHKNHDLTLEWFKQNIVPKFPHVEVVFEYPESGAYSFEIVLKKKE